MEESYLFTPAPFFFLRTAHFPIEAVVQFSESESLVSHYLADPILREAIAISSFSLYEDLAKKKYTKETLSSLLKYALRMASRPTPFGLFAFVAFGSWEPDSTEIRLQLDKVKKEGRADMEWAMKIFDQLKRAGSLTLKRNPLIYESKGRLVLSHTRKKEEKEISVRASSLVLTVLEKAKNGKEIDALVEELLAEFPALEKRRTEETIFALLDQEFLFPSFFPSLLDTDCLKNLFCHLPEEKALLDRYNAAKPGEGESLFIALKEKMELLAPSPHHLQVDAYYPEEVSLPSKIRDELQQTAQLLFKLSSARNTESSLQPYHAQFLEKYGTDRLVPLLELLDVEKGLGNPFRDHETKEKEGIWNVWLQNAWYRCIANRESQIDIPDEILESFKGPDDPERIPLGFDLFCELIEQGDDFLICLNPYHAIGTTASSLGRFLYLFDEKIRTQVAQFLAKEEELAAGAFLVETSYFPLTPRTANVAIHPHLRKWRLDLGFSKEGESTLSLEDILVGANPKRFYFTSPKCERELLFMADDFLNPEFAPLPLRFLRGACVERYQFPQPFYWGDLQTMPFLPRVQYKKTILSPALWHIVPSLIGVKQESSSEEIEKAFSSWAQQQNLSRELFLTAMDQRILLDWTLPLHAKEIGDALKRKGKITLIENIGAQKFVKSQKGTHSSEFVFSFLKNSNHSSPSLSRPIFEPVSYETRWPADWLYVKLYMAVASESNFLLQELDPNLFQSGFFVRYQDERGTHIRLRMQGAQEDNIRSWARALHQKGIVKDFLFAPYEREVERFGGEARIDAAERFFCADSQTALSLLKESKRTRIQEPVLAALSIIDLLKGFGLDLKEQLAFFSQMTLEKKMLNGFREWKLFLLSAGQTIFYERQGKCEEKIPSLLASFAERKEAQAAYLQSWEEGFSKSASWVGICQSFLHMHCNRTLGIQADLEAKAIAFAAHTLSLLSALENLGHVSLKKTNKELI